MDLRYIDAHCHVQFDAYEADREAVLDEMRRQRVGAIVVGVDYPTSVAAIELARTHEGLYASVGLHPNHTSEVFDTAAYRALAADATVVAIGECGLDYFRPETLSDSVKEAQKQLLRAHIALAVEADKPLIIHARPSKGTYDAYDDLIAELKEANATQGRAARGDIHFFVGSVEQARELAMLGFTLSFTAVVTFARDYDAAMRAVPLSSILAETDAPYVAPVSRRGKRNDPLAVIEVVAKIAEVRGEDPETVRAALLGNTVRLFRLPE